ncbi:ABC transporter permease, partial [Mycolicibacterium duvalii]
YLLDEPPDMTPSFPRSGVSGHAGAVQIVAIVSSLRGMEAKGGPRGVADAVNSSVVVNVVLIVFANLAITQLQSMFVPTVVA